MSTRQRKLYWVAHHAYQQGVMATIQKMLSHNKSSAKHCNLVINITVLCFGGPGLKYHLKPYLHCYTGRVFYTVYTVLTGSGITRGVFFLGGVQTPQNSEGPPK